MNRIIVFYDQSCGMCVGVTGWLTRIDGKKQFQLEPYQNSDILKDYPELKLSDMSRQIHVINQNGKILKGADAMIEIWRVTGHWTSFMSEVLRLPPFIWIARPVYRLVAKYRKLF